MSRSRTRGAVALEEAVALARRAPRKYATVFRHGSLDVEMYALRGTDPQTPHTRDEVYIVASGRGVFRCGRDAVLFAPGDFFFVPAGLEHRFEDMTDDFATWVLFYGPEGGEEPGAAQASGS